MRYLLLLLFLVEGTGVVVGQAASAPLRSVWDGVYTQEQANRGKALYITHCARCHGADLGGLPGNTGAPELRDYPFVAKYVGMSVGSIWQRTRLTMPQDKPGSLTRTMNADIVAFLLNASAYPTGQSQLPADMTLLDNIRMEW